MAIDTRPASITPKSCFFASYRGGASESHSHFPFAALLDFINERVAFKRHIGPQALDLQFNFHPPRIDCYKRQSFTVRIGTTDKAKKLTEERCQGTCEPSDESMVTSQQIVGRWQPRQKP